MKEKKYQNRYLVKEDGTVMTLKGRKLKGCINQYGYLTYRLIVDGKPKTVKAHRLVMEVFLGKSDLVVNHKDENKLNNTLSNLEYVTRKENTQYSLAKKVELNGIIYDSVNECAIKNNISASYLSLMLNGKRKNNIGIKFLTN